MRRLLAKIPFLKNPLAEIMQREPDPINQARIRMIFLRNSDKHPAHTNTDTGLSDAGPEAAADPHDHHFFQPCSYTEAVNDQAGLETGLPRAPADPYPADMVEYFHFHS